MNLTAEQRRSLWDDGGSPFRDRRIVSALPGTGKTATLAAYCADLFSVWDHYYAPWQGMALLSYTNVAKDEIASKFTQIAGANVLGHPHYSGTIDSFLNQYIFLPHGSAAMGAAESKRPRLVGEPHGIWRPGPNPWAKFFEDVHYNSDGSLAFSAGELALKHSRKADWIESKRPSIVATKKGLNQAGVATQSDANYFAYKCLAESDHLTKALILRFPVVVIDEAQDMTETQHKIVDHLVAAGLSHIVLIGDERQAIYEWNTAKPILFRQKIIDPQWQAKSLTESFRCSRPICTALNSISGGFELRPCPTNKNAAYNDSVEFRQFSIKSTSAAAEFIKLLDDLCRHVSEKEPHRVADTTLSVAVLTRSRDDAAQLHAMFNGDAGGDRPDISFSDSRTRLFLCLIYFTHLGLYAKAFSAYERLLMSCGDYSNLEAMRTDMKTQWLAADAETLAYRHVVIASIRDVRTGIQKTCGEETPSIVDCIQLCELQLKGLDAALKEIVGDLRGYEKKLVVAHLQAPSIAALFPSSESKLTGVHGQFANVRLTFSTIHGVKGETHDGVLLILRRLAKSCGCASSSTLNLKIVEHDILNCESKRIQYVAMSRPAQYLMVAVESDVDLWRAKLCPPADLFSE